MSSSNNLDYSFLEIGTIEEIDTDSVDWDSLEPPCESIFKCGRPAEFIVQWQECEHYNALMTHCAPCQREARICIHCKNRGYMKIIEVL